METRTIDQGVAFLGSLARDTADIVPDPDHGWMTLTLRPLYGTEGVNDRGVPQFNDNSHLERSLVIERFDLLGGGNLGMAHAKKFENGPDGTYSVIRPVSDQTRRRLIDLWDQFTTGTPLDTPAA
ncbi:hypothetical protein DVS28_b0540 (plasmid) [Euzebya pacifica]|uniref:Uncharacterized protein n=2 Tax=Euzebya pacifica TaxID=1608957 RepID=A0A346Y733_9ACTN|nr:hypothetical protein DVS28_b0540 [Euzebya pacifica]